MGSCGLLLSRFNQGRCVMKIPIAIALLCVALNARADEKFDLLDPKTKEKAGSLVLTPDNMVEINGKKYLLKPLNEKRPKTLELAHTINIDELEFRDLPMEDVVKLLRKKVEESTGGHALIISLLGETSATLTFSLKKVTLDEALAYFAQAADMNVIYEDYMIKIVPKQ